MPTREEKLAAIKQAAAALPSREQKLEAIRQAASVPKSWLDHDLGPDLPLAGHVEFRPRQIIQSAADALPGGLALLSGGAAALGTGGIGALPAAGWGGATGQSLKNLIESQVLDKPKTREDIYSAPLTGAVDGLTQEMGGQIAGKVLDPIGKYMYKSGLKKLDAIGARYNKEPVSDLLMENRVTGSAKGIQEQMDELGDKLLNNRNQILKDSTAKGAEVDMNAAVKRAQDVVDQMRKIDHPEMRDAVDALQNRIDIYKSRDAKNAEDVLRQLPVTKPETVLAPQPELPAYQTNDTPPKHEYDLAGRTNVPGASGGTEYYSPTKIGARAPHGTPTHPNEATLDILNNPADQLISLPQSMKTEQVLKPGVDTVFDQAERVPGPTPIQTSSWKSSNNSMLPDSVWKQIAGDQYGSGFDKALNGGLRDATEMAVGKAHPLGPDAQFELHQANDDLGKILTSKERAMLDAEQEAAKNGVTSVDALALAHGGASMAILKKLADISKMTYPRTVGGLGLQDFAGSKLPGYFLRPITTQDPDTNLVSPWLRMGGR